MFDIKHAPTYPGCYLFKDETGNVLYVGKAKNLKKRVKSYVQKHDIDPKTQSMLHRVNAVDFLATDTELEALILENTLIKQYQPRYNIRLKDAKSYAYIQLTDDAFPRICIARRKTDKGRYYGPFVSAQERDYLLHFLQKTFTPRTCRKMPKKPCLRHHINLCDAPCISSINKEDYREKIEKIKLVLSGKNKQLKHQLHQEMNHFAEHKQFELAIKRRNELTALDHLSERQNLQREKTYNEDIINYMIKDETVYLMLFNIYKGTLSNKNEFIFDYHHEFFEDFLVQYYAEHPIPKEVIIPEEPSEAMSQYLKKQKGQKVRVTKPQKGEKKQLLNLVLKNIDITFFADVDKVETLKTKLKLQETPAVIECFDISHLSGTSTVGSMVQYRNGKPDKNSYRRFRIRTVEGIDDCAGIAEVVKRRYTRLKHEDAELPNLIIIDGGRGQLNVSLQELEKLNLKIPLISIAKQFEEIYIPGLIKPIQLVKKDKALQFIQEIRDEAHRFALKYNRLLRKKGLIT